PRSEGSRRSADSPLDDRRRAPRPGPARDSRYDGYPVRDGPGTWRWGRRACPGRAARPRNLRTAARRWSPHQRFPGGGARSPAPHDKRGAPAPDRARRSRHGRYGGLRPRGSSGELIGFNPQENNTMAATNSPTFHVTDASFYSE